MTLLISVLIISKVNLAYERYRTARHAVGSAFTKLRELHQLILILSSSSEQQFLMHLEGHETHDSNEKETDINQQQQTEQQHLDQQHRKIQVWRTVCTEKVMTLLETTRQVLHSPRLARHLSRNTPLEPLRGLGGKTTLMASVATVVDPMEVVQDLLWHMHVQSIRSCGHMVVLERLALQRKLSEYVVAYGEVLEIASTPLPFVLVQMGRVFLFLWTFSMPLVLRHGPFVSVCSAMVFLFFLTYGFIGLELLAMQLATPFGPHDVVRVHDLGEATLAGMDRDLILHQRLQQHALKEAFVSPLSVPQTISQRRRQFANQKTAKEGTDKDQGCVLGCVSKFG